MSTKPNKTSQVQIHLLRKNKPTSDQRNKSDPRTKYLDKPVRKPKEIETCAKAECIGEDVSNGDFAFNLPHPRVEK